MPALIFWLWLLSTGLLDLDLAPATRNFAAPLHQWCVSHLPVNLRWHDLYGAIVCGANPPPSNEKFWFQTSGLYHLLVVSGSHLIFLSQWLKPVMKGTAGRIVALSALVFYSLVCLGSPPVLRALIHIVLCLLPLQSRLRWSASQICFLTGVVSLTFYPGWATSLSFWLSWLASMLCSWAERLSIPPLSRVALIQGLLAPGFGFSNSNLLLSVLGNWLLGPLLGKYLFACALLATLIPPLRFLCDFLWSVLIEILKAATIFTGSESSFSAHVIGLLVYVSILNFLWMGWERCRRH